MSKLKRAPEISTIFGSQLLRQESIDFGKATQKFQPPVELTETRQIRLRRRENPWVHEIHHCLDWFKGTVQAFRSTYSL